ncbi:hypothetical protein LXL04_005830 [Taraxacum kok-saghyz]
MPFIPASTQILIFHNLISFATATTSIISDSCYPSPSSSINSETKKRRQPSPKSPYSTIISISSGFPEIRSSPSSVVLHPTEIRSSSSRRVIFSTDQLHFRSSSPLKSGHPFRQTDLRRPPATRVNLRCAVEGPLAASLSPPPLQSHPTTCCLHCNRLIGNDNIFSTALHLPPAKTSCSELGAAALAGSSPSRWSLPSRYPILFVDLLLALQCDDFGVFINDKLFILFITYGIRYGILWLLNQVHSKLATELAMDKEPWNLLWTNSYGNSYGVLPMECATEYIGYGINSVAALQRK